MRRYTLNISNREFVVDVQEIDADNFEVVGGGGTYLVNPANEPNLAGATVTPSGGVSQSPPQWQTDMFSIFAV